MLGKRQRTILPDEAPPGKKLRANLNDLFASGLISAARHMSLLKDAFEAGVDACYSEVANKQRHPKPHSLLLEILKANKWPMVREMDVPLQHKSGQAVPGKLAFLLPHELLFALVANSAEGSSCFEETDGLDSTTFAHVLKISQSWQKPLVAISLWQDAVPYNWDRSESLEVYSWSLPGLSDPKARNMRFPVVVCPNHWTVKETHMQIMEVLSWSFAALAEGCWPQHGPHGGVWHNPHSGSFGFLAACVEFKGDWKMLSSLIGLPMWKNKDGVCWRCQILKEEVKQVGEDAAWRLPQHRTSHGQLLSNLQAKGKMSPIWDFPGFEATCIRIDWLHVMDLGVTSYWFGAVLHLAVTMLHLGPNQKERAKAIFRAILAWYKRSGINSDRLKALPVTRFKPKGQRPALKASAGQVRALVPYFVELTSSWTQEMYNAEEWAEITLVQQGCRHLLDCYDCLSLSNPKPLSVLREKSIAFSTVLVQLEEMKWTRYTITPKLHLFLELTAEGCRPSQSWCYREEDFGGFLAGVARRRGGHDSALATSRNTLMCFMAKQPLPEVSSASA